MRTAWRRELREQVLRERRTAGLSRLAGVAGGPLYARRRLFDHRQLEGRGSPGGRKGPAGGLSHGPQGSRRRQPAKPRRCVGGLLAARNEWLPVALYPARNAAARDRPRRGDWKSVGK